MAKPAFIYAFDSLGPGHFAELCGDLLGSRYAGFFLGGVGPDGGIDAEFDAYFGEWKPESASPLLNEIYRPGHTVVFQFKHKVSARVGQSNARTQLLQQYRCARNRRGEVTDPCELHSKLIRVKAPSAYVLVTNVEVNGNFRHDFIQQCREENMDIARYQVIGLDELASWVTSSPHLRHLYFPTIFGPPQFYLRVRLDRMFTFVRADQSGRAWLHADQVNVKDIVANGDGVTEFFRVTVMNVGTMPSYVDRMEMAVVAGGQMITVPLKTDTKNGALRDDSDTMGAPLEPGRSQHYNLAFDVTSALVSAAGETPFVVEMRVWDQIDNVYVEIVPEDIRTRIGRPDR